MTEDLNESDAVDRELQRQIDFEKQYEFWKRQDGQVEGALANYQHELMMHRRKEPRPESVEDARAYFLDKISAYEDECLKHAASEGKLAEFYKKIFLADRDLINHVASRALSSDKFSRTWLLIVEGVLQEDVESGHRLAQAAVSEKDIADRILMSGPENVRTAQQTAVTASFRRSLTILEKPQGERLAYLLPRGLTEDDVEKDLVSSAVAYTDLFVQSGRFSDLWLPFMDRIASSDLERAGEVISEIFYNPPASIAANDYHILCSAAHGVALGLAEQGYYYRAAELSFNVARASAAGYLADPEGKALSLFEDVMSRWRQSLAASEHTDEDRELVNPMIDKFESDFESFRQSLKPAAAPKSPLAPQPKPQV